MDIPSFLRRPLSLRRRQAAPHIPEKKPAIDRAVWKEAYSLFGSVLDDKERSSRLKRLRDQTIQTDPDDFAAGLLNSLWRLSTASMSVADFSSVMVRLLRTQSSQREIVPLCDYYSFMSLACGIVSIQDVGRIPLQSFKAIGPLVSSVSEIVKIPMQVDRLFEIVEFLSEEPALKPHLEQLNRVKDALQELAKSFESEIPTPEVICLTHIINQWLELAVGAIKIYLGHLQCCLATSKPLYPNRVNEIQIAVSGGSIGQRFRISIPLSRDYDAKLDSTSAVFRESGAIISMRIRPHVAGPLTILIEIEGVTFQTEALVLLENPFIVGIPVQSDEMFVGRQDVVGRIIRGVVAPHPTNFLITGRRRIGKTSLLYAIRRQLPKGILPVLVSTESCGESPVEICQALANAIAGAISEAQSVLQSESPPAVQQDAPVGSFISWLQTLREGPFSSSLHAMVLLIDEAQNLTEWDDRVQSLLRHILSSMTWIRGVLAGPPDIIERMTEDVSSPLYNIFTTLTLGPIDVNDTCELLVVPLQKCGIADAESMLSAVYDYSGGIPFYIQAIGQELIENHFSGSLVGGQLLSSSLAQVRERLQTSYPVTLTQLSAAEKVSIVSVANGVNPPRASARRLEQADLIEMQGNRWTIRAGIEREWVNGYMDQLLDSAAEDLWAIHKKEIDLLQFAKDLRKLKKESAGSRDISEAVASALAAAEKGNGAKALKHLSQVGQWGLDTATKIGADVAAAALRQTYGLS